MAIDLGWFYTGLRGHGEIVGCANAVNLTDGLDGLAHRPVMISATTLGIFAYVAATRKCRIFGHSVINGAGEIAPLTARWWRRDGLFVFNTYPRRSHGRRGSLSLGGFLEDSAVLSQNDFCWWF